MGVNILGASTCSLCPEVWPIEHTYVVACTANGTECQLLHPRDGLLMIRCTLLCYMLHALIHRVAVNV